MDHLLVIDGASATPAGSTSLPAAQFLERKHLQEWLITNPQVLGADILVVTSEYGSWAGDSDGAPAHDRLDILGIDGTGRLVVVELKRGTATRDIHLQAITYAALVSRFTTETLARAHRDFLRSRGEPDLDVDEARHRILEHVGDDLDPDLLRRPRLMLVASVFPRQVTHTVVWLSEMNVDISLVQVSLWRVGEHYVAGSTQVYPTPAVEEFTLAPVREESTHVASKVEQRTRNRNAVHLLHDANLVPVGTRFRMVPGHGATQGQRAQVEAWLDGDDSRRWARWQRIRSKPLRWEHDGEDQTPTGLATRVLSDIVGGPVDGIQGTAWWVLDDPETPPDVDPGTWAGLQRKTLVELAAHVRRDEESAD